MPADDAMKKYLKEFRFMFAIDALVLGLLLIIWFEVRDINQSIVSQADRIEFYGQIFLILVVLVAPVLHIMATMEFLKPGIAKKMVIWRLDANWLLILFTVGMVALSFGLKRHTIKHIEKSGYVYCDELSHWTSFSKVYVFFRSGLACEPKVTQ